MGTSSSVDLGATNSSGGSGGGGGGSGTVTQVNSGGLLSGGPITTTGTLTVSSINLTTDVVGLLPNANLASISFTSISGSLPLSRTTGSLSVGQGGSQWLTTGSIISYSAGNVGIGTTTPGSRLTVSLNTSSLSTSLSPIVQFANVDAANTTVELDAFASSPRLIFRRADTTAATPSAVQSGESLGVVSWSGYGATAYSGARGQIGGSAAETWTDASQGTNITFTTTTSSTTTTNEKMRITDSGNVGIGTASTSAQLHTTGTVRFANFGVGTATFDANGNISSVSDEDLKEIKRDYRRGLSELRQVTPVVYKWRAHSGLDTHNEYVGFTAQSLQIIEGAVYAKPIWIDRHGIKLRDQKTDEIIKTKEQAILDSAVKIINEDGHEVDHPDKLPLDADKKELLSVSDRALIAAIINSIKELDARITFIEGG